MKIKRVEIGEAEALLDRVKDSTLIQEDYELIKEFVDTLILLDQAIMKEQKEYKFLTPPCNIAILVQLVMMVNSTDNYQVSLSVSKVHHHFRQLSMNRKNCGAMSVRRFSPLAYPQMQELKNMMRLLPLCLLYSDMEADCL